MENLKDNKIFMFSSDKLSFKAVDNGGVKSFFVEGYISTGDLDLVNDIVTKGCMDDMFGQFDGRSIKLDFEHEAFRGKDEFEAELNKTRLTLGKAVSKTRDEKGLKVTWELNPTWKKFDEKGNVTMTFKDVWKNVEGGFYDAFSIAYIPTSTAMKTVEGKEVRLLDRLNLFNVALTGNPVNPSASMTSVMAKSLEYMREKEEKSPNERPPKAWFDRCVRSVSKRAGVDDPEALCAWIYREKVGGKNFEFNEVNEMEEKQKKKPEEEEEEEKKKEKKDDSEVPAEEAPEEPAEKAPEEPEKVEGKSTVEKDMVEVKSEIKKLKDELATKDKEIKELKAVLEKPQHKGLGAENKAEKEQKSEVTSKGPLDSIQ